jgi:pimeloyl-ACP methyl ester carboxylesterase
MKRARLGTESRVKTFSREGLTFDVRDDGPEDGDPVVLLHGFPQDSTAWDDVSPLLTARGLRTLAPDQRGYSPLARPRGRAGYRLRETAADVLALLDAAGLPDAHVVGHDWGGLVAWALGAWHPERIRSLTVLSVPHPAGFTRALLTSRQPLQSWYVGFFQLPLVPESVLLAGGLRRSLVSSGLPERAADRYLARLREPRALSSALAWYRALPWSAPDRVGRIGVPTLHVWSTGDHALNRAGVEASARFVDAPYRLEVLDGLPHWLPEVAPARVADLVASHCGARR